MESKRKILSIGINYVGTSSELHGCVNDSHNLLALVKERYPDKKYEVRQILDGAATKAGIMKGFDWLVEGMGKGDKMILHYSGHGSWGHDASGDESDGRDEFIVPNDCDKVGLISDDVIREHLINRVPKGAMLHMLMDCCHSKTIGDLKYCYEFKNGFNEIIAEPKVDETPGTVVVISGCADVDYSADTFDHDVMEDKMEAQGAMTCAFIRTYRNKRPTYTKLIQTMREYLSARNYSQVVQLTSGRRLCVRDRFELF